MALTPCHFLGLCKITFYNIVEMKQPMRPLYAEGFGMREKGWLGHKETTLHQGDSPIWQVRWGGNKWDFYLFGTLLVIDEELLASGHDV